MLQAALLDCLFFDLFPFSQNGFVAAEVDVGGCDVVQALVVSLVVVIFDEGPDLALKITGQGLCCAKRVKAGLPLSPDALILRSL